MLLNFTFSISVCRLVFSIPLVIKTRQVPQAPSPWQFKSRFAPWPMPLNP
jgi:hypothetical protein